MVDRRLGEPSACMLARGAMGGSSATLRKDPTVKHQPTLKRLLESIKASSSGNAATTLKPRGLERVPSLLLAVRRWRRGARVGVKRRVGVEG